jgi:hypothetical protein
MRFISSLIAVCSLMLAFNTVAKADDQVDNPVFKIWSNFNVGSDETLDATVSSGGFQMQFETNYTLAEKADDHVTLTVTTTMTMMGQTQTHSQSKNVPAKMSNNQVQQTGSETVQAAGKSWDCKIYTIPDISKPDTSAKAWVNDGVPGGIVKMEAAGPRGTMSFLLKSYDVK